MTNKAGSMPNADAAKVHLSGTTDKVRHVKTSYLVETAVDHPKSYSISTPVCLRPPSMLLKKFSSLELQLDFLLDLSPLRVFVCPRGSANACAVDETHNAAVSL